MPLLSSIGFGMLALVTAQARTATIRFTGAVHAATSVAVVRLPEDASGRLPSRGQVAVDGTLDGQSFRTVLEPDGERGHWFRLPPECSARETVEVEFDVAPAWPEPEVPADLAAALRNAPADIRQTWDDITPMARWEWVRWVNATANPATRQRRVEVSISKMANGKRRPCCFDLSACTDPTLARSGKLRLPG